MSETVSQSVSGALHGASPGPQSAANVRGYPTGPIDAKGAFTAEIDLPPQIGAGALNTLAEGERSHFVNQPGMRHKYMPLRHNPATGALSSGGRYLFRRYEDAIEYRDFLEAKVFPGEQTTFWNRPFFFNTVRFAWRVAGAHDLAPITTHDVIRFERYSVPDAHFEARLPELYSAFLEAARRLDLAHISLMFQPQHNLVGVVTSVIQAPVSLFSPGVGLSPQFQSNYYLSNKGYSAYNSMLLSLRKRLSHNLQMDFNYTFSHSIDKDRKSVV